VANEGSGVDRAVTYFYQGSPCAVWTSRDHGVDEAEEALAGLSSSTIAPSRWVRRAPYEVR